MNVIPVSNLKEKRDYCQNVAWGLSDSQDHQAIMVIMNKVMNFYTHTSSQMLKILQKSLNISNSSEALPSLFRVFWTVNSNFLVHFV